MFANYLHTTFHIPSFYDPLVTDLRLKAKRKLSRGRHVSSSTKRTSHILKTYITSGPYTE